MLFKNLKFNSTITQTATHTHTHPKTHSVIQSSLYKNCWTKQERENHLGRWKSKRNFSSGSHTNSTQSHSLIHSHRHKFRQDIRNKKKPKIHTHVRRGVCTYVDMYVCIYNNNMTVTVPLWVRLSVCVRLRHAEPRAVF